MADIIFRYAGQGAAPYGDPYTVLGSWPEWVQERWISALKGSGYTSPEPAWVPTFESGSVSWPENNGQMQTVALDPYELPTRATVDHLAALYGPGGKSLHVIETPFVGAGPVASNATTRLLQWPNLATLPANQLAKYYAQNPEDRFPHVADNLCKLLIARIWSGG